MNTDTNELSYDDYLSRINISSTLAPKNPARRARANGKEQTFRQRSRPPSASKNKKEPAHSGTGSSFFSK